MCVCVYVCVVCVVCVCVCAAVEVDQPPASSVRRFLALLEQSDIDFSEELGESVATASSVYMYMYCRVVLLCFVVCITLLAFKREMRRKKERSKQGQTNKAKQHSTPKAVTFPRKNELPRVGLEPTTLHTLDRALYQLSYRGSSAGWAQISHLIVHLMNRLTINSV